MSNFQKHAFLSECGDLDGDKTKTNKSGSYSPGRPKSSSSGGGHGGATSRHDKRKGGADCTDDHDPGRNTRSKCSDPNVPAEDLIMLGMYRLNAEQEEVYRRFVEMVSTFDDFDKVHTFSDFSSYLSFALICPSTN